MSICNFEPIPPIPTFEFLLNLRTLSLITFLELFKSARESLEFKIMLENEKYNHESCDMLKIYVYLSLLFNITLTLVGMGLEDFN